MRKVDNRYFELVLTAFRYFLVTCIITSGALALALLLVSVLRG